MLHEREKEEVNGEMRTPVEQALLAMEEEEAWRNRDGMAAVGGSSKEMEHQQRIVLGQGVFSPL